LKHRSHRGLFLRVKGKNTVMWVVLAVVGSCVACTGLVGALALLGLVSSDEVATSVSPTTRGSIPTGNTPDLFPGMPGWLPSGNGVAIPEPRLVDDRPEGLWWLFQANGTSQIMILLPDGTRATNPRPGGGMLFDVEGQRAQRGSTGVGTFQIDDGKIVQHYDGFDSNEPFESGTDDDDGEWFKIGGAKYAPLFVVNASELSGTWKGNGSKFIFREDGTYDSGQILETNEFVANAQVTGTWTLDGYLISFTPSDRRGWIGTIGRWGSLLLINGTVYSRQE
jgi:hypothetical protein